MENILYEFKKNKKLIFISIILILGVIFICRGLNKSTSEEFEYLSDDIKNYEANKFIPVYVTDEDIAEMYLNEYKNKIISDVESAYNLLNVEYRDKKFGNLDNYKNYINEQLSLSTYSMTMEKYSISTINGYKVYSIYDKSGYHYIFKEISIMNFEVYLDEYTVSIK